MIELLLTAENALALGLNDQAERTFHQVLEADPQNGIAAVGLARVALERGDDAGALALANAALEIDPENATARRMVERLEEVARYRAAAPAAEPAPAFAEPAAAPAPAAAPEPATEPTASEPATAPPATLAPVAPPSDAATASPSHPTSARPGILRRLLRRS